MVNVACSSCGTKYETDKGPGENASCPQCGSGNTVPNPKSTSLGVGAGLPPLPNAARNAMPSIPNIPSAGAKPVEIGMDLELDLGDDNVVPDPGVLGNDLGDAQVRKANPLEGIAVSPTVQQSPLDMSALSAAPAPDDLGSGVSDLPAASSASGNGVGVSDLPAPMAFDGIADPSGLGDLPAPVNQSGGGQSDLPAPASLDLGSSSYESDLPAPAAMAGAPEVSLDDHLPEPVGLDSDFGSSGPSADSSGDMGALELEPPAAGDDMPSPLALDLPEMSSADTQFSPTSSFGDLPEPSAGDSAAISMSDTMAAPSSFDLDGGAPPLELDGPEASSFDLDGPSGGGALELGAPEPEGFSFDAPASDELGLELDGDGDPGALDLGGGGADELALPELPSPRRAGVVSFKPGAKKSEPEDLSLEGPSDDGAFGLDVENDDLAPETSVQSTPTKAKAKAPVKHVTPQKTGMGKRAKLFIAAAVVLLGGLSAGGFVFYRNYSAAQAKKEKATKIANSALALLRSDKAGHWASAAAKAEEAISVQESELAMAVAAQAYLAGFLADGTQAKQRKQMGGKYVAKLEQKAAQSVEAQKAMALKSMVDGQYTIVVDRLQRLVPRAPKDGDIHLYLGWAQARAGAPEQAITSFQKSIELTPTRKVPALLGLARAHYEQGADTKAFEAYQKVLAVDANNLTAQIGKAVTSKVDDFGAREATLQGILARKDIGQGNPRSVAWAYELSGYEALRAKRLDAAKARYLRAAELWPKSVGAQAGLAEVLVANGDISGASKKIDAALSQAPAFAPAIIAQARLLYNEERYSEAIEVTDGIAEIADKLPTSVAFELQLLRGNVFREMGDKIVEATKAYNAAQAEVGDGDIRPTIMLANYYNSIGNSVRAQELLSQYTERAETDASLALALGVVHLSSNKLEDAEKWFQNAVALEPDNPEMQYQLGRVYQKQGRLDEALATLRAAYDSDKSREDIGLYIAQVFEELDKLDEADKMLGKILEYPNATINALAWAGRYYVRQGQADKVADLGKKISELNEEHATGHFLLGMAAMSNKKYPDAIYELKEAVARDPQPAFYYHLGRANEESQNSRAALTAYSNAVQRDPEYLEPVLGQARIYSLVRQYELAVEALERAKKLVPKDESVAYLLGSAILKLGDSEDNVKRAMQELTRSVDINKEYPQPHLLLAKTYVSQGKERKAAKHYEYAIRYGDQAAPWLPGAYRELGYLQRDRGKRRDAIKAFEKYLSLATKETIEVKEVRSLLAELRRGR